VCAFYFLRPWKPPFILDRNHASLIHGEAGMQSRRLRGKATNRLKMAGRQAGKRASITYKKNTFA
jgi:hypothetical protein